MDTTQLKKLFEKQRDVEEELEGFNRVYEKFNPDSDPFVPDQWNIEFSTPSEERWEDVTMYNLNKKTLLGIIKGFITSKNGELKQLNKRINNEINSIADEINKIAEGEQDNG